MSAFNAVAIGLLQI